MKKITDYIKEYNTQQAKDLMKQHFEIYKNNETKDEIYKTFEWYYNEFLKWLYEVNWIKILDPVGLDNTGFDISYHQWKENILKFINEKWMGDTKYIIIWYPRNNLILSFSNDENLKVFQEFSRWWNNKYQEYRQKQLEVMNTNKLKKRYEMDVTDVILWKLNINKSFIDEKIIKSTLREPMKTTLLQMATYNRSVLNTLWQVFNNNVIQYANQLEQQYGSNNNDVKYLRDIINVQNTYFTELTKLPWHLEISLQNGRWYLNYIIKNILLTAVLDKFKNIDMDYILSVFSWIDYIYNDLYFWKNTQVENIEFLYNFINKCQPTNNKETINLLFVSENT